MTAATLWGLPALQLHDNEGAFGDNACSSTVERYSWSQICQRWAINVIIAIIALTLLTLLVTYFGHTFSFEGNRIYFIIFLLSLVAIAIAISLLFCKNRRKPQRKKANTETAIAANETQAAVDVNNGGTDLTNNVNNIVIDL